jgi:hypothetical protein
MHAQKVDAQEEHMQKVGTSKGMHRFDMYELSTKHVSVRSFLQIAIFNCWRQFITNI